MVCVRSLLQLLTQHAMCESSPQHPWWSFCLSCLPFLPSPPPNNNKNRKLAGLGVPALRTLFSQVFGQETASNNAAWLRRKLAESPDSVHGQRRSPIVRARDQGAAIWNQDEQADDPMQQQQEGSSGATGSFVAGTAAAASGSGVGVEEQQQMQVDGEATAACRREAASSTPPASPGAPTGRTLCLCVCVCVWGRSGARFMLGWPAFKGQHSRLSSR